MSLARYLAKISQLINSSGQVLNGGIADGAVDNAKISGVAAGKVSGLAAIATSASASDLSSGIIPVARMPSGAVLQAMQATNASTYSLSAPSNVPLTGMSITITPRNANSRFLIQYASSAGYGGGATHAISVARNGSSLNYTSAGSYNGMQGGVLNGGSFPEGGILYIDSPGTTSPITYTIIASADGTFYVGRRSDTFSGISQQMVVMEIAG